MIKIGTRNKIDVELLKDYSEESISGLLQLCLGDDVESKEYFMNGFKSRNNLFTIEAKNGESLIGLLTAWKSNFYPFATYISIAVDPCFIGNVESKLIEYLEGYLDTPYPLQTSIWETTYAMKNFYMNNGFKEIRRTYMSSLCLSNLPINDVFIRNFSEDLKQYGLYNLKEIADELKNDLIKLVIDIHAKTHEDNPLGVFDTKTWEHIIFGDDTLLEGSYILLNKGEISAFSLLHDSDTPKKFEFGWRGTKEEKDINQILYLTAYQIDYARKQGVRFIIGEIDTTDKYSLEMLKYFPFSPAPTWITYQKKR